MLERHSLKSIASHKKMLLVSERRNVKSQGVFNLNQRNCSAPIGFLWALHKRLHNPPLKWNERFLKVFTGPRVEKIRYTLPFLLDSRVVNGQHSFPFRKLNNKFKNNKEKMHFLSKTTIVVMYSLCTLFENVSITNLGGGEFILLWKSFIVKA